ncbi:MAG TPA: O-antigen ligase family protein [Gemmatimonadaceae bacterium]
MQSAAALRRTSLASAWTLVVLAGVAVLVALPYRSFDLDRFFVPKEMALHVGAALTLTLVVASGIALPRTRTDRNLIVFLALSAVSALLAVNGWLALRALSISVSAAFVWWAARATAVHGGREVLIRGLATATVLGAATALAQAYGVSSELASMSRAPGGTFGNRNFMAHVAAAGVPLLGYLALTARGFPGALLAAVGLGINAAALVLSRTRAAWLALVVCAMIVVLAWLWRRGTLWRDAAARRGLILIIAGVVVGGAGAVVLPNSLDWRSDNPYLESAKGMVNYREGSGRGRLRQYVNSVTLSLQHPTLGVGPGNWAVEYPGVAPPNDPSLNQETGMTANPWPSSDWMAMLSERGIPAFVVWAMLLAGLAISGLIGWGRLDLPLDERLRAVTATAVVAVVAVEGAFDAVLLLATPTLIFWATMGALIPPVPVEQLPAPLGRGRRILLAISALLLGLMAAEYSALKIASMAAYSSGQMGRAVSLDPGSFRARLRYAQLMMARTSRTRGCVEAKAALELFPRSPDARRLAAGCKNGR